MLALALMLLLPPQQHVRGPIADDDGTGRGRPRDCRATPADAIVVCQRADPNGDRLGSLPAYSRRHGFTPAIRLPGGGEARAEAVPHDAGIAVVPAAMLSIRLPIGQKKKKAQDEQK